MDATLKQREQKLLINPKAHLLMAPTVRAVTGLTSEKIKKQVECGKLLWVFDFAITRRKEPRLSSLRFWAGEFLDRGAAENFTMDYVLGEILGVVRSKFAPGEVCQRFAISKTLLMNIRRQSGLPLGDITRIDLTKFLKSRWTGKN